MTMDGEEKCFHSGSSQENITEVKNKKRRCIKSCKKSALEDLLNGDPWRSMVPRKERSTKFPVINMKEEEKKKAALALMVLSKDTHPWRAHCSCSQPFDDTDEYFNAAVIVCEDHEFKKLVHDVDDVVGKQWKKEVINGDDCRESGFKSVKKIKRFECSICGRVFGSGQGLGCHKRVHKVVV